MSKRWNRPCPAPHFVFLRFDGAPNPVAPNPGSAHFGHVGWGFALNADTVCFGATENSGGHGYVPPGGPNGAWVDRGDAQAMRAAMRRLGYNMLKTIPVPRADALSAVLKGEEMKTLGYRFIGSNCADHSYWVLESYGVQGMPPLQLHPSPNGWFNALNGVEEIL